MFRRILIANRGEIACRIIATARRLGVESVAVYSEADAKALHVRRADQAVAIGRAPAKESYLDGEKIIAAALASGAAAIHPGYGFLSENADFAEKVAKAGLVFIGPPPSAIRAMGAKHAAKRLMRAAGVPVVPGYDGDAQDDAALTQAASEIGYPLLIKAALGGGGRGMRRAEKAADLADAIASARREALAAFGDGTLLIEKYLTRPRHIEVQIFADAHGAVVHLFERDCSLQRRHQKVIEEAPAPGLTPAQRQHLTDAAIRAALAIGYVGAGTIEFIADADNLDAPYFMEMNTRLQVEHPVTEAVTGLDLVEWQLRVASGEKLPRAQDEIQCRGHAMELRVCAEDPAQDFRPETGRILDFFMPVAPGLRWDGWIETGTEIGIHYDSLLGKLIAIGATRAEAIARLSDALRRVRLAGITGNLDLLARALAHPDFVVAEIDTGFIANHADELLSPAPVPPEILATFAAFEQKSLKRGDDPWGATDNWRLTGAQRLRWHFSANGIDGSAAPGEAEGYHIAAGKDRWLHLDGKRYRVEALGPHPRPPKRLEAAGTQAGEIHAPMPGRIVAVLVKAGDEVGERQVLLRLEAMKMEHALLSPLAGQVAGVHVQEGDLVAEGALLAEVAP